MANGAREILERTRETLSMVEIALGNANGSDPVRRQAGLYNVAVFGRAVTNMLQNLRSVDAGFDTWYAPWREEMEADTLLRYFYELRSDVLKVAKSVPTSNSFTMHRFEFPKDLARFGPPPPGAHGIIIGDRWGRSGWKVTLPDGREEIMFFEVPADMASSTIYLLDAPETHLGTKVPDRRIGTLCGLYRDYLARLVGDAFRVFSPRNP